METIKFAKSVRCNTAGKFGGTVEGIYQFGRWFIGFLVFISEMILTGLMCPSTACPVQKPDYVSWSCHRVLQPHSSTNAVNWSEGAVKWSGHAATPFCSFRICFSDERSKSCVSMKIKSGACIGLWVACKNVIRNRTCCFYKKNPRKLSNA